MKEKMVAIIEGLAKPGALCFLLLSKYPRWIDSALYEVGGRTWMRGACPTCQQFRSFSENKKKRKWRCPKCKKYYTEEEIVGETIRFIHNKRREMEASDRLTFICPFCREVKAHRRVARKYKCPACDALIEEETAKALAWNLMWLSDFI